jgi:hypothetical protein
MPRASEHLAGARTGTAKAIDLVQAAYEEFPEFAPRTLSRLQRTLSTVAEELETLIDMAEEEQPYAEVAGDG